jgi:tRNA/tmRNA/rRNA uracil-C5-methylase (TrmA/RlmC/RlmD family)
VDFETYEAPYRKYKMGYKKKIAYEFDMYRKLQCELNRHDATNGKYEADVKPCITFSDESRKKQENIDALLKKYQSKNYD